MTQQQQTAYQEQAQQQMGYGQQPPSYSNYQNQATTSQIHHKTPQNILPSQQPQPQSQLPASENNQGLPTIFTPYIVEICL